MPVHDSSRSDQDERLAPPGQASSQRNPEQLVQGSQSMARSLHVQSQQLVTERKVFKDEVLLGPESADHLAPRRGLSLELALQVRALRDFSPDPAKFLMYLH
jgi:hypothetical protein